MQWLGLMALRVITRSDKADALSAHWAFSFNGAPGEEAAMCALGKAAVPLPAMRPPGKAEIRAQLARLKASAPRADGIQFSAWSAYGEVAVEHVFCCMGWLLAGRPMGLF